MKLTSDKNIFEAKDFTRSPAYTISNSQLHQVPDERIVKAARGFKSLCYDHLKDRIKLDLSENELLSAFEVMLLPYYFPHDTKQERNIRFFIHLCKILLNNKVERKKRPTMEQMEQLLIMEQLEGELLIYSQNITQNTL